MFESSSRLSSSARRRGQQRRRWERKNNKIGANRTSKMSEFLLCTIFLRLYVFNIQKKLQFRFVCAVWWAVREGRTQLKVVRSVNLCEIQRGSYQRENRINEAEKKIPESLSWAGLAQTLKCISCRRFNLDIPFVVSRRAIHTLELLFTTQYILVPSRAALMLNK